MPWAPRRPCPGPNCRALITRSEKYCAEHKSESWRNRPSAALRGYDATHRKNRLLVLARDNHTCRYCGAIATQVDHVVALAQGGQSTLENMVACCARCNHRRGSALGGSR